MYCALYLYPVTNENEQKFIEINKAAGRIYMKYGAVNDQTFQGTLVEAIYGCRGMVSAVKLLENEKVMLGISSFHSKVHHDEVMKQVDQDEEINKLYLEMTKTIDISRVVRGEFEEV
ncbi:DUF1428 family protein [Chryseomicrobium palamuruense]|uniref:DUF1428 family protein n=1 Tax=Chryseomicrobium palamuruense TaxID=682973 RepID=A0ABV8USM9_9BACL